MRSFPTTDQTSGSCQEGERERERETERESESQSLCALHEKDK